MSASDRQRPKRLYDNGMTAGQVWNNRIGAVVILALAAGYSWFSVQERMPQLPSPLHAAPAQLHASAASDPG